MESTPNLKAQLNPVVFSLMDDGNPNRDGIESLPILVDESSGAGVAGQRDGDDVNSSPYDPRC